MKSRGFWIGINLLLFAAIIGLGFWLFTGIQRQQVSHFIQEKQKTLLARENTVIQEGNVDTTHITALLPVGVDKQPIEPVKKEITSYVREKYGEKTPKGVIQKMVFISSKKVDTHFNQIKAHELHMESYQLDILKIKKAETEDFGRILLTPDYQVFTLETFLPKLEEAKMLLSGKLKEQLLASGKAKTDVAVLVQKFKELDLQSLPFSYQAGQFTLQLPNDSYGMSGLTVPVSDLYALLNSDYLSESDKGAYDAYMAEQQKDKSALRQISLTFDDGPDPRTTPVVLDLLKKYNAKGTFFVVGRAVPGNDELLKRIVAEGHVIGNHTWNHPDLTKISAEQVRREIQDTQEVIKKAIGSAPTMVRPPYGSLNAAVISQIGLPSMYWSVDTLDWKTRNPQSILGEVKTHTRPGSIILMHDIHKETVASLEPMLQFLSGEGYHMVTLTELLGEQLNPNYIYYSQDSAGPLQ